MAFVPNPSFDEELREQPTAQAALVLLANRVRVDAELLARASGAPWMPRSSRRTFEVEVDGEEIRVVNTDHAGHLLEWGSANNPPHAPLRRAVRAAGHRLDEQGRA